MAKKRKAPLIGDRSPWLVKRTVEFVRRGFRIRVSGFSPLSSETHY